MTIEVKDESRCVVALFKGIESLHMVNGGTVSNFADALMCLALYDDLDNVEEKILAGRKGIVAGASKDAIEATVQQCVLSRESLAMLVEDLRTAQNNWDRAKVECFGTTDLPMTQYINNDIDAQVVDYQIAVDEALKDMINKYPDTVSDRLIMSIKEAYIDAAEGELSQGFPDFDV